VEKQALIIFSANQGYLDDYPVAAIRRFETELYRFIENRHPEVLNTLREKKAIDTTLDGQIRAALEEFKGEFQA